MKKLFCTILLASLVLTTACGKTGNDTPNSESEQETTIITEAYTAASTEVAIETTESIPEFSPEIINDGIDEESLHDLEFYNETGIILDSPVITDHIANDYFDIKGYFEANGFNTSYQQNETGNYFVCVKDIITIMIRTEESRIYIEAINCTNTVEEPMYIAELESDTGRLVTDYEGIFYDTNCLYVLEGLLANESALRDHCCPFARIGVYHWIESSWYDTTVDCND